MTDPHHSTLDQRIVASLLVSLCRLLTGVRARWQAPLPNQQARIYFANHSSHLDGLVIWASMPKSLRRQVRPVAAADYWLAGSFRRYLAQKVFNAVLIERNKTDDPQQAIQRAEHSQRIMSDALAAGYSLIIFPEGTRGNGEQIQPFKSGLWYLVQNNPQAELVPVYLENLNRVLPKGSRLIVPVLCSATFAEPLPGLHSDESKTDFLTRCHSALEELAP